MYGSLVVPYFGDHFRDHLGGHLPIYARNLLRSATLDTVSDITLYIISKVMSAMMSLKWLRHQYISYTLLILESYTQQLDYMGYSLENHKWSQIEAMHNGGTLGRILRLLVSSFVY